MGHLRRFLRKKFFLIVFFSILTGAGFHLQAQDIRLLYDITYSLNFNRRVPIGLEIVTAEGKHLSTKGYLKGKIPWRKLDIKVTGGKLKKGTLFIDSSNKVIDHRRVRLDVYYKDLNIRKTLYLEMKFDGLQVADYKPKKPKSRPTRSSRVIEKIFLTRSGKDGKDGRNGKDGPLLRVLLDTQQIDGHDILAVTVLNRTTKQRSEYFINPHKGTLLIRADGADGGNGGGGGPGVDDKDSPSQGGNGGAGGNGGKGGFIEVIVPAKAKQFLHCLSFSSEGGRAGSGGKGGSGGSGNSSKASDGDNGIDGIRGEDGPKEYLRIESEN